MNFATFDWEDEEEEEKTLETLRVKSKTDTVTKSRQAVSGARTT